MSDALLDKIKESIINLDPVAFAEKYLTLEGKPFRINGNGYKPLADIYRYMCVKALEKDAKPLVVCKSRQVGMTVAAAVSELYFMGSGLFGTNSRPPIRVIHAFPQLDYAFDYSKTKLAPMINSSVLLPLEEPKNKRLQKQQKSYMQSMLDPHNSSDSLQFKQFINGNHLWIESVGLEGNRLRGKTADVILFDEVQDAPAAAISNSVKVLNKAQYGPVIDGVQIYFGTPKLRGSEFYRIWEVSNQQYYYLGCAECKKHFPLYTPNSNEWENIWLYGFTVRCTHCGHEQDKREAAEHGKWIATRDTAECKLIGFHINQLYNPDITKEKLLSDKPGVSPTQTERSWQNEVLGEFYQGEATIMTADQIRDICGDPERKYCGVMPVDENVPVFLGLDIGDLNDLEQLADGDRVKTQGQSFSVAVVLALTGSQRLSVVYAEKFKKNDFESKKTTIERLMRLYGIKLAVCDIGYANDLNPIMQTEYGGRFLSSRSSGTIKGKAKFDTDIFPKIINFEKDYWIAVLYEEMKKGNIRFPLGSFEQVAWLIQHCTSMEVKPSISRLGEVSPHYVKGGVNDGMMALLNAFLAYRFYLTDGFTIQNPLLMKNGPKQQPPVVLGYIPKMR